MDGSRISRRHWTRQSILLGDDGVKTLEDMVQDWGGFERLVAELHDTGTVTVEHDVILTGRSGAPRQIDVLVRHREGFYEHLIVVECKYRNSPVERIHVDALTTTVREVGASRGVIFSTRGFQSGAITQAAHDNIALPDQGADGSRMGAARSPSRSVASDHLDRYRGTDLSRRPGGWRPAGEQQSGHQARI